MGRASVLHTEGKGIVAPILHRMVYDKKTMREYQRKWVAKRRQDWIDSQGGVCAVCGSSDRLEVDHIDRATKLMQPAAIWSRRQEVRDEELAKCQVLCYYHHRNKTRGEISEWMGTAKHGSHTKYSKGCRCTPCTEAHADLARVWRYEGKKW